jgi:hypothetical protein
MTGLDDLRLKLLEVQAALDELTEAIAEGLRLLDQHGEP